ncbi:pyrroline-5-carboxylate reductase [Liquorilactobacillus aquaticus DSM 21051]|uniref:Pyrroline-5-carboxylate reductase n=1 Tax=Liquorilactobacillus aquaticus DSM 21051 TaxID=1423725 RepID=A0A0R2D998_9LACO|nr:pyrroline-5-carboxylate reductase dimerization domain-containing protein [Liquorilactobacillus aquaticus]KRM96924.1 pyrroline-5-carboxylate reductase [Liquorilactobacillus aquaticus DSM 21051]
MTVTVYAIGGGQMVEAILRAALRNKIIEPEATVVTDVSEKRVNYLHENYGVDAQTTINEKKLKSAEIVLLGVRPQDDWEKITAQIGAAEVSAQVISIIAGVTLTQLQTASNTEIAFTRIIPNTLTDTGYGYSGVTLGERAERELVTPFLESFGKVDFIPEEQIDLYTGYAVCGPNYVYNFYIALTNAGVLSGLSRKQANAIALENLKGAAKFLELTGKHPYELLDINNSAGGVGINAQHEIDASGFAAGIQNAVLAAVQRTTELGKKG